MGQEKFVGTTGISGDRPKWTGKLVLQRDALEIPHSWRKGRWVFVNSMSDLFHDNVPLPFIQEVFSVMADTPRHSYEADRLAALSHHLPCPDYIWMGVSIENADYLWRAERLAETGAAIKFLSLEPPLGPVVPGLDLSGIDWIIAGGESGPGARPMNPEWVRAIRDTCVAAGVAFHFKQWGGVMKKRNGRVLDGRTWDEFAVSNEAVL